MAYTMKIPDYEGGFLYKEVVDNYIVTRDKNENILSIEPVNFIKKGVECSYGKVVDYADNVVILEKGGGFKRMSKSAVNDALSGQRSAVSVQQGESDAITGTFETAAGKVYVEKGMDELREILTDPDHILLKGNRSIFTKSINSIVYSVEVEEKKKGLFGKQNLIKSMSVQEKKQRLLIKGTAVAFHTSTGSATSGMGWNQQGGMKPGHKYIDRKPNPKGKGYIYLYKLPNGKTEWRDEAGQKSEVRSQKSEEESEYKLNFEPGENVQIGDKVGQIKEVSDNFIAVNIEGQIKTIDKRAHIEKLNEQKDYKVGEEINYQGGKAKVLQMTENLALIKKVDDGKLKVIELEKKIKKSEVRRQKSEGKRKEEDYKQQPEFSAFTKAAEQAGLGKDAKGNELVRSRLAKVGNEYRSVKWVYDPDHKDVRFYVDGVEDYPLYFAGEKYKIRNITDEGYSLENKAGETGLFLSNEDYDKYKKDYEEKTGEGGESVITPAYDGYGGELIQQPKKTFHFSGKLSDEQLKKIDAEKERENGERRGYKISSRVKRNASTSSVTEPIQTEEDKARVEDERKAKQESIKTALQSEGYKKFEETAKGRGFDFGENKFTASKTVEIEGKKFKVQSEYKPETGKVNVDVDGPVKALKMGDAKYPITDITKDKVYYDDEGEKEISIGDLKSINGKSIFEPTKVSKGIISNLPPQRIYFGLNEKDSAAGYYEIVDADDLTASHLPGGEANSSYSITDAQNRDRSTPQSIAQINKIAANPNFDFLSDSKTATDGAPVVNQDYNVIAGNGRTIGVKQHYQNGGDKYKQDLLRNADKLGFDKAEIEKIKNPVLVRRMNIDNKEAQRLGAMSNTSNMLATEAREEAKGKATRIDDKTFNNLAGIFEKAKGEHNSISDYLEEVGPDIVKELVSKNIIPENEQHLYFNTSTGKMDAGQKDKVKELLTQSILGDSSKEFEHIPDAAREGISKALGDIFSLKGKEGDLVSHLQNAVKILAKYNGVKDKFSGPDAWIAQDANNAFEKLTGDKEDLALFDLMTSGKPNEMKNKIREYKQAMEGDMFNEGLKPEEAFNQVFKPKYEQGINKSLLSRIIIFGKRFLQKSVDTTRNVLMPSKKNPNIKRWQSTNNKDIPEEMAQKGRVKPKITAFGREVKVGVGKKTQMTENKKEWKVEAVAYETNGKVYAGKHGETHGDLYNRLPDEVQKQIDKDLQDPDQMGFVDGFVDNGGEYLTRGDIQMRTGKLPESYIQKTQDMKKPLSELSSQTSSTPKESAADFAREKHGDQKYNGGNYFDEHVRKVAEKAREIANSGKAMKQTQDEVEMAAYLHDILEDTNTSYNEIAERFGKETADIVLLLSDKLKVHDESRRPQAEGRLTEGEYFKGIGSDFHAAIIKAADRIENIQSLSKVEDPKRREKLYNKYKGEMKYFRENRIYPGLVEAELGKAEGMEQGFDRLSHRAKGGKQIHSENFKKWFGDSVITEDGKPGGKPLVVYHGTNKSFEEFHDDHNYFSDNPSVAMGYAIGLEKPTNNQIYPVYLKISNPLIIDANGRTWHEALALEDFPELEPLVKFYPNIKTGKLYSKITILDELEFIKARLNKDYTAYYDSKGNKVDKNILKNVIDQFDKYDGYIIKNVIDVGSRFSEEVPQTTFVTKKSNQIKSAIGNDGSFDAGNPNITKSISTKG